MQKSPAEEINKGVQERAEIDEDKTRRDDLRNSVEEAIGNFEENTGCTVISLIVHPRLKGQKAQIHLVTRIPVNVADKTPAQRTK